MTRLASNSTDSDGSSTSRRRLLRIGAAVATAGIGALAGCTEEELEETEDDDVAGSTPHWSLTPEIYADHFDRVVVATDVGADPTGEKAIDPILNAELRPGTLLHFPEGVYKMNSGFRATGRSGNLGVTGDYAVIRHGEVEAIDGHWVTEGEYYGSTMMFRIGSASRPHRGNFVFGGLIFDWGWHENAGMQGLNAFVDGEAEIRNILFSGLHSLGTHGNLRVATASPDSFALVESIDMLAGGLHYSDTINTRETERYDGSVDEEGRGQSWSTTGVTGHPEQEGTVLFRDITCGPWPGSPIYVRGGEGRKIVSNCAAWNSGGNQIRVNGGDAWDPIEELDENDDGELVRDGPYGQTTIENCSCWIDRRPEGVHQNQRGILLQDGPQTVRNCEIEIGFAQGSGAGGTYGIGTRGAAGPVVIENCSIILHEEMDAVYVSPRSGSVEVRNTSITTVGWNPGASAMSLLGGTTPSTEGIALNTISG